MKVAEVKNRAKTILQYSVYGNARSGYGIEVVFQDGGETLTERTPPCFPRCSQARDTARFLAENGVYPEHLSDVLRDMKAF